MTSAAGTPRVSAEVLASLPACRTCFLSFFEGLGAAPGRRWQQKQQQVRRLRRKQAAPATARKKYRPPAQQGTRTEAEGCTTCHVQSFLQCLLVCPLTTRQCSIRCRCMWQVTLLVTCTVCMAVTPSQPQSATHKTCQASRHAAYHTHLPFQQLCTARSWTSTGWHPCPPQGYECMC